MATNAHAQNCVQLSAGPPALRAARLNCPAAADARRGRARAWLCVRAQQTVCLLVFSCASSLLAHLPETSSHPLQTSTWTEELRGEQRVVRITGGSVVSEEPVRGGGSTVAKSAAESSQNAALVALLRDFFLPPGFPYTVSGAHATLSCCVLPH